MGASVGGEQRKAVGSRGGGTELGRTASMLHSASCESIVDSSAVLCWLSRFHFNFGRMRLGIICLALAHSDSLTYMTHAIAVIAHHLSACWFRRLQTLAVRLDKNRFRGKAHLLKVSENYPEDDVYLQSCLEFPSTL